MQDEAAAVVARVLLKHNTVTTELLTTPIINMECVTANTVYMYVLVINSMFAEQFFALAVIHLSRVIHETLHVAQIQQHT